MGGIIGAVAGFAGNIIGGNKQAKATNQAADKQADAARYSADIQKEMFDKQIELQKPWREAGSNALTQLTSGIGAGGEFSQRFSDTNWQKDPGYQFRLSEGLKALDRQAAARGGLISGTALKAAQAYGQNMASDEYQNAFNRYYTERQNIMNPLQSLAGIGQTSANALGNAAANYANSVGNIAMNNAASQGNALMAGANIRASQYQGMGRAFDQLSNANWGGFGNAMGGLFGSGGQSAPSVGNWGIYNNAESANMMF